MTHYIIRRLMLMIPVLICVTFVVYFLMDLAPGDIVSQVAPAGADRTASYRYGIERKRIRSVWKISVEAVPWRYGHITLAEKTGY